MYVRGDGQLAKVLEDQVFPLSAGEATAPIRTRQGFVIFKVTQHTPAGIPPLSAVDEQVQNAMFQELMVPARRAYLTGLREKAYVDIAPGFVDTGASLQGNQARLCGLHAAAREEEDFEGSARSRPYCRSCLCSRARTYGATTGRDEHSCCYTHYRVQTREARQA